ncbi:30S ribosomal protein S6 [Acidipila sp. EB88]|uniref:30S ribosomal protein S6 n=1 Tax=Acidipila sp. EB88 TaxID=2305226 RepID=UPI000F5FAE9E|nr:30S ribosomal protein S6 [Acidipila sp. EB88]RRA48397.1 30S ribosomal protein S6 [Acidipila sp. EB88]
MAEVAGRFYEVMFIIRPDASEEDMDKLISGFETTVTSGGGNMRSIEKMGRRKLAYTVRKFNDGNYVLFTIDADGKLVAELERRLRVSEPVIKFLTVRMDEEEKRLEKVRALRASKTKRSAQPSASAEAAQAAPAPAAPAAAPAPAATEAPALA